MTENIIETTRQIEKLTDERRSVLDELARTAFVVLLNDRSVELPVRVDQIATRIIDKGNELNDDDLVYLKYWTRKPIEWPELSPTVALMYGSPLYSMLAELRAETELEDKSEDTVTMYEGRPALYRKVDSFSRDLLPISDWALESNVNNHEKWLNGKEEEFVAGIEELLMVDPGTITTEFRGTEHHWYHPELDTEKIDSITYWILEEIHSIEGSYAAKVSLSDIKSAFDTAYGEVSEQPLGQAQLIDNISHERTVREKVMEIAIRTVAHWKAEVDSNPY